MIRPRDTLFSLAHEHALNQRFEGPVPSHLRPDHSSLQQRRALGSIMVNLEMYEEYRDMARDAKTPEQRAYFERNRNWHFAEQERLANEYFASFCGMRVVSETQMAAAE